MISANITFQKKCPIINLILVHHMQNFFLISFLAKNKEELLFERILVTSDEEGFFRNYTSTSEILDLTNPNMSCSDPFYPPIRMERQSSVGGLLFGRPIICGDDDKSCFRIEGGFQNNFSRSKPKLMIERTEAAAVSLKGMFSIL